MESKRTWIVANELQAESQEMGRANQLPKAKTPRALLFRANSGFEQTPAIWFF